MPVWAILLTCWPPVAAVVGILAGRRLRDVAATQTAPVRR